MSNVTASLAAAAKSTDAEMRRQIKNGDLLLTAHVREVLDCSLTELNRWAKDERLAPCGSASLQYHRGRMSRCWSRKQVEASRSHVAEWRAADEEGDEPVE